MRRQSESNPGRKKGQWFIISAIIASGAFLVISIIFMDFTSVDTSTPKILDADFYFSLFNHSFYSTVDAIGYDIPGGCVDLQNALDDVVSFNKRRLLEKGIILNETFTVDCVGSTVTSHLMFLSSDRMQAWEGSRPEIQSVNLAGPNIEINLKSALSYDFSGEIEIFDSFEGTPRGSPVSFFIAAGFTTVSVNPAPISPQSGDYVVVRHPIVLGRKGFFL
jgi:hypothetical protein